MSLLKMRAANYFPDLSWLLVDLIEKNFEC